MILLDTSVFIEYFRKQNNKKTLLHKLLQTNERFSISVITHFEIMIGNTSQQNSFWEVMLENISILDYNFQLNQTAVSIQLSLKKINKKISFQDLIIGATAKYYTYKLATLNEKHFINIPELSIITSQQLHG